MAETSLDDWVRVRDTTLDDRTYTVRRMTADAEEALEIVEDEDDPAVDLTGRPTPPKFSDKKASASTKKSAAADTKAGA